MTEALRVSVGGAGEKEQTAQLLGAQLLFRVPDGGMNPGEDLLDAVFGDDGRVAFATKFQAYERPHRNLSGW
ncbi:hypothetical protein C5C64_15230 [Rathayibacter sp. AY1D3]|nr:hypothetical protein C5C64_15230 [Rathayibacter sp. AY1D3]